MCGFVGVFGALASTAELDSALDAIIHRGPDGRCSIARGLNSIAACRLAITPPMDVPPIADDGVAWMALNGELYGLALNADETDTMAALRIFRMQGGPSPTNLASQMGLFSLAYADAANGIALLARDRFGIKPLYWAPWRGGIAFASEMKALLALGVSAEPDDDVKASCAAIGFNVLAKRTPYRKISSITPGTCLVFNQSGQIDEVRFADPRVPYVSPADDEAVDFEVERLLDKSVGRAMQHDPHPKAIFLSGGLDSTLLLHLAAKHGPLDAFTLWDGENADDCSEARLAAKGMGVPWHQVLVTAETLDRAICHYAWHFERPIGGGGFDLLGGVAFHVLAETVAKTHRVALCGEGADELFFGYHQFHMVPQTFSRTLMDRIATTGNVALATWAKEIRLIEAPYAEQALVNLARVEGLSEYHLPSVDASGMAYGLEIRPPFLDADLVAFATSLPTASLVDRKNNWTKLPLRRIMAKQTLSGHRAHIRRKRAMSFAVTAAWRGLLVKLGLQSEESLLPLLADAHEYLRSISPTVPPPLCLSEIAVEAIRARR